MIRLHPLYKNKFNSKENYTDIDPKRKVKGHLVSFIWSFVHWSFGHLFARVGRSFGHCSFGHLFARVGRSFGHLVISVIWSFGHSVIWSFGHFVIGHLVVAPLPRCPTAPLLRGNESRGTVAPLPRCPIAPLPHCPVAPLPRCPVALLPRCPVAPEAGQRPNDQMTNDQMTK